jgi:hypothetical protein
MPQRFVTPGDMLKSGTEAERWTPVAVTDLTKKLRPDQDLLIVTTIAALTTGVVLPSAIEAAGRHMAIRLQGGGGGTLTVYDSDGTTDVVGANLTAAADYALMYSDGYSWHCLKELTT